MLIGFCFLKAEMIDKFKFLHYYDEYRKAKTKTSSMEVRLQRAGMVESRQNEAI